MNWLKQGQIFNASDIGNGFTHAQVPYPLIFEDRVRIYFTSRPPRDEDGFTSCILYLDLDINDLSTVLDVQKKPLIELGKSGAFDEFGTMPCSVILDETTSQYFMYYVGWTRMKSTPYNTANGLAISKDGKSFVKYSDGPIMGQNATDPYIVGCPRVYRFNNKWYNWYISGYGWKEFEGRKESLYDIKLAESEDGIHWQATQEKMIPKRYEDECQTCASVFEKDGLYHMYFTYRHAVDFRNPERGYRIGYAFSSDMKKWERNDDLGGIDVSESGWDSEMVCYPFITQIKDQLVMFYCGNEFGKHGFGYAILEK
jgi:sucrose-6-phosphate hydrolase SacC (GH32 family)